LSILISHSSERGTLSPPDCFEADAPSGWAAEDFQHFVEQSRWIFAKTMPHNPHEYTLRRHTTAEQFDAAVRFVRENGVMEEYWGRPYKTLYFGDHKYWTMGEPLESTILINRKLLPHAGGPVG
jgi:hypothetical protein